MAKVDVSDDESGYCIERQRRPRYDEQDYQDLQEGSKGDAREVGQKLLSSLQGGILSMATYVPDVLG
jgi:hypothetical protein